MRAGLIVDALAQRPHTAAELAERLGFPCATVRADLAELVFQRQTVTCDRRGRYSIGNPERILKKVDP
jgi:DNA-binding IclR family transcriptional regulator